MLLASTLLRKPLHSLNILNRAYYLNANNNNNSLLRTFNQFKSKRQREKR